MNCPIRSVSEVALWVDDVERSVLFYQQALGFTLESLDYGRNAFLRAGDFLLVLFNPRDPGTSLAAAYLQRTGGPRGDVYHVAFRTEPEDLDAYAAGLRERGLEVTGPVDFTTGRRSYFVEDPDQHYIEITDR